MSADGVFHESGREILFEIVKSGNAAQVSAIDAATGIEVFLTGPANLSPVSLRAAALRKLLFVLQKQGIIAPQAEKPNQAPTVSAPTGRGRLV
jgi:hypothetical protein